MSNQTETGQAPDPFAAATGSALVDLPASVVYRTGQPTAWDYEEAIRDLSNAATQLVPNGFQCAVCGSCGHQAWECRHNPLVMARRQAKEERTWRCFHCGAVFTDYDAAREHFGPSSKVAAACCSSGPNESSSPTAAVGNGGAQLKESNGK